MFKKILVGIILLPVFFLVGCATHIPLSKANARLIDKIYVDPAIKQPKKLFVNTRTMGAGMTLGGVAGLALVKRSQRTEVNVLQAMIDRKQVEVDAMLYQQWVNQLKSKSHFKVSKEKSEVVLETEISSYGISPAGVFSFEYAPNLAVTAKLVRDNQVIWQDKRFVFAVVDDLPKAKFSEMSKDPRKFGAMLNKAAELAVNLLITDMEKQA